MNSVKTLPVPHISEEDVAKICKSHRYIGLINYGGAPIRVYYWPWEEIPGVTGQTDMVLFRMSDDRWFIQPVLPSTTIQDSLTSLCGHQVSIQSPMVFTRRPDNWVGISATTEEVAMNSWSDYWLGGQNRQIRRLELTLTGRRLKPQPRDNMGLFFTYDEYLDMYLASAGTKGFREQAYYMEKAIRAAAAEGITELHSYLTDTHATSVATNAARPYGELNEDWEDV